MACGDVPLGFRVFYGFLAREGPRAGEAEAFEWRDFDLDHGVVKLDENKTDDPRAWALDPGVVRALKALRALREAEGAPVGPRDRVFVLREDGRLYDSAKLFRAHLRAAGIDRPELFDRTASRLRIRRHDLRATFVTLNLAAGRTETWIADRTGHKSSDMINRYRRVARTAAELRLGELAPLDRAIPELASGDGDGGGVPIDASEDNDSSGNSCAIVGAGDGPMLDADEKDPEKDPREPPRSKSPGSGAWIRTTIRGFKDGVGEGEREATGEIAEKSRGESAEPTARSSTARPSVLAEPEVGAVAIWTAASLGTATASVSTSARSMPVPTPASRPRVGFASRSVISAWTTYGEHGWTTSAER